VETPFFDGENMRLDKFLKLSRLIKRRPIAKMMADNGRIQINQKTAKASSLVSVGDKIELQFGTNTVRVEVLQLSESSKKEDAKYMFKIIE
jgi:ribosomal 50S subunit-recycling heat shock protein